MGGTAGAVPAVAGRSEQVARLVMAGAQFRVETVRRVAPGVPVGTVVGTRPWAGAKAQRGSIVELIVCGRVVPKVVDLPVAEARSVLEAAGFAVVEVAGEAARVGEPVLVLAQHPGFGTVVGAAQRAITITTPSADDDRAAVCDRTVRAWPGWAIFSQ